MLIKQLNNHNEYLITIDLEQLGQNANVTPALLKALLMRVGDFSVAPTVFGSYFNIDHVLPGCQAPRPPVHALTHQVMGLPRLDASGEICQIKIQMVPPCDDIHSGAYNLVPMLYSVMNNEQYDLGGKDPYNSVVYLRQLTALVPRIVNPRVPAQAGNYTYSLRDSRYPVTVDVESEGTTGDWEIHGWDFIYATPSSVTDGGSVISDPATGPLNLYLDHNDPDPAGTLATIINTYFNMSANHTESKYVKFYDYLEELELMISNVRSHPAIESPELSPAYIDELLREVRAHAVLSWIKQTANNL